MPKIRYGGSTIGSTVETGEITDGAVTEVKLATAVQNKLTLAYILALGG